MISVSHARITLENHSPVEVERLYYNLEAEVPEKPAEDLLYFHAQFRRSTTEAGKPVVVLQTEGRGHYVGTVMSMQPRVGRSLSGPLRV